MTSLEQRLEKAQQRRAERMQTLQTAKKPDPSKATKPLPSQAGPKLGPSMMDHHDRKAKTLVYRPTTAMPRATAARPKATTQAMGFNIGDRNRIAPKVYRKPSYWDAQGGGFQAKKRGEGKTTQAVGFKLGNKDRVNLRPQWATKMIEAGLDPMMAIQGLTTDEVAAYLEDEGQMYQLTEGEITQLKHLVELQLLLEADPEIGVIEGADEVLNLMARLAGVGGDLTELHPADQAAILSLIQFNNVVPGFGSVFDEDEIEATVEGPNNFVQFTDHTGTPVFIRKGSYVKAQVLEKKIESEISKFETFNKICFIVVVILVVIYVLLKSAVLFYVFALSGNADGFSQAFMRVDQINNMASNITKS